MSAEIPSDIQIQFQKLKTLKKRLSMRNVTKNKICGIFKKRITM